MRILFPIFCLWLTFLSGCASFHPNNIDPPPMTWPQHEASILALPQWSAKGHILLQSAKKSERAHLYWFQNQDETRLSIIGPLGSGRIELTITPEHTSLSRSDGFKKQASTPEDLMQQVQGWPVPITPAKFWLRGLPDLKAQQLRWNPNGTLHSFESHGWQIQYLSYTTLPPYYPKNIIFKRAQYAVTVSLYEWGEKP